MKRLLTLLLVLVLALSLSLPALAGCVTADCYVSGIGMFQGAWAEPVYDNNGNLIRYDVLGCC